MAETFSDRYAFVGPSIAPVRHERVKEKRLQVYISLGTVLFRNESFYNKCVAALRDMDCDVVMSVGTQANVEALGELPLQISAYPRVNQMEVLSKTDVFVTHCGMNSAMESLYCGVPMVLFPQHAEERAVADRIEALGAGVMLRHATVDRLQQAVKRVLSAEQYREKAEWIGANLREAGGAEAAACFIEKRFSEKNKKIEKDEKRC